MTVPASADRRKWLFKALEDLAWHTDEELVEAAGETYHQAILEWRALGYVIEGRLRDGLYYRLVDLAPDKTRALPVGLMAADVEELLKGVITPSLVATLEEALRASARARLSL